MGESPDRYTTNNDFFDLKCSSTVDGAVKRTLHVDVDTHGQFVVSAIEGGTKTAFETGTYTNAIVWSEGPDFWILDRFKGTLKVRGSSDELVCSRTGGRVF